MFRNWCVMIAVAPTHPTRPTPATPPHLRPPLFLPGPRGEKNGGVGWLGVRWGARGAWGVWVGVGAGRGREGVVSGLGEGGCINPINVYGNSDLTARIAPTPHKNRVKHT
jgi:hypothetical protein